MWNFFQFDQAINLDIEFLMKLKGIISAEHKLTRHEGRSYGTFIPFRRQWDKVYDQNFKEENDCNVKVLGHNGNFSRAHLREKHK